MRPKRNFLKLWNLVQRENAVSYMLISLMSSIATVTVVRSVLALTGYPQLGSGSLHIAHVLWGGLILYIAAVLPLIYLNPQLQYVGAILSGVGVGLFIDEVGKFITRQYDYFDPAAAPIMYVFFLLVVVMVILINRPDEEDGRSELVQALEIVRQQLYRPLEAKEKVKFEKEINQVLETDSNPLHADLARNLLNSMRADNRIMPESSPSWWMRLVLGLESWLTEKRLERLLEIGMIFLSLVTIKNPLQAWLESIAPNSPLVIFLHTSFGRQIGATDAPLLFDIRLGIEILVGVLLIVSVILMLIGQHIRATNLGLFCLLVSLVVLDMLLFYFEQFSSVLIVAYQFIVLTGFLYYRRKFLNKKI